MRSVLILAVAIAGPALAAEPRGSMIVVANKEDSTVTLIEVATGKGVATLPTGQGPHEVAISPDGKLAVIADYGKQGQEGKTLTVVDLGARKVQKTIDLGEYRRPHGIAFLPHGRQVAVTVEVSKAVLLVDVASGKVSKAIVTGQPVTHMLALSGDGRRAYTANIAGGSVSLLDLEAGKLIKTADVAPQVEGLALTPDGKELWVGSNQADTVTVLDAETLKPLTTLKAAGLPIRVAITPDGKHAVVTNATGGKLQIFDVRRRELLGTVEFPFDAKATPDGPPGPVPIGTVIAPDSRTAYVSLMAAGKVAVVDLAARTVKDLLPTGGRAPDGIAILR